MFYTIACLVALAVGAAGSYEATKLYFEHVIDQNTLKARAEVDAANTKAQRSAADYEMWKANNRPRTITVTKEVASAVQADPDCSAKPLPDQLRDALTAAGANADQPLAADAVPAPRSTGAFDLGSAGNRLLGRARGVVGLSSAASSPR